MKFSTPIPLPNFDKKISYQSEIVLLGSCFAENIGEKLQYYQFQCKMNPFGILFNPISISKLLSRTVHQNLFTEDDFFFYNERWSSFDLHSDFSETNIRTLVQRSNETLDTFFHSLQKCTHLFITLGSSWVYRHLEKDEIVANCHKVPQKKFQKELLSVEAIMDSLMFITKLMKKINAGCQIVYTISPVRHSKDGFFENNVSKSNLFTALYSHLKNSQNGLYFPAYEIVMDELRDYRFYKSDMLHPNDVAVAYVFERFTDVFTDTECRELMEEVESVQRAIRHKPFSTETSHHRKFVEETTRKMATLKTKIPFLDIELK